MTHVFVLGRRGTAQFDAVRAVIRDWSAVGLLHPSVWLDVEPAGPRGPQGLLVADGRAEAVELLSWIPRHEGPIRLICLQVLTDPSGAVDQGMVQGVIDQLRLPSGTPLINLLAPVDGLTGLPASVVFDSQVNVLVQPVDATGPQAPSEPLTDSSRTFAMHIAAALATAGGLWSGMEAAPLDGERPWSGARMAAARGYVRHLDATALLDQLATSVFGGDGRLPVSRSPVGEALGTVPAGGQLQAAEAAAQSVLDKHRAQTRFQPSPSFVPPAATKLGFVESFRMFFSFVFTALLGSPVAWVQDVLRRAQARIGESSTRFLFGDESRYQVVLGGLAAGGPGSDHADQLDQAARHIVGRLAPGSEIPPVGAPSLWSDAVRTAAVLVDGGNPTDGILTPTQGPSRLVVDDPRWLATAPGTAPFPPVRVRGSAQPIGPIAVEDPYSAMQVYSQLDAELADLTSHPGGAGAQAPRVYLLQQVRQDLAGWIQARRGFTWTLGVGLAAELDKARAAQAEMLNAAGELTEEDLRAPVAQQRKVRRIVLLWLTGILLALILLGVLAGFAVLSWKVASALAVAVLVLGMIAAVLSFGAAQRALFQAIHKLDVAAARRKWLTEHGVRVSMEVIRLAGLYRQGRCWSAVIAANVHDPFGGAGDTQPGDGLPTALSGELPLSVTLVSAHYSPIQHESTVYQARAHILRQGWLVEQIQRRRSHVLADLKWRTGRDLESRIDSDIELRPDGPLNSYLLGLRDSGLRQQARQSAVTDLVRAVSASGSDRLLPMVRVDAGAIVGEHPWSALSANLLLPADLLADEGFSPTGVTNGASRIGRSFWALIPGQQQVPPGVVTVPTRPAVGRRQLDRMVIRWDLSQPVPPEEFGYFGDGPPTSPDRGFEHGPGNTIDVDS